MKDEKSVGKNSGFELMRIIAMIAVVCGHWYGQYGSTLYPANSIFVEMCCFNHRIANLAFIFISCYFLQNKKWNFERFMALWLKTFMETSALSVICYFVFHSGGGIGFDSQFFSDIWSTSVVYISPSDFSFDSSISRKRVERCFNKKCKSGFINIRHADSGFANLFAIIL